MFDEKYAKDIQEIELNYKSKIFRTKAQYLSELKLIEDKKQEEMKPLIKEWFDYQIPIAKVEKAGITTTGAPCENELNDVLAEYKEYNNKNPLWNAMGSIWDYVLDSNLVVSKIDVKKQVKVGDLI